MLDLDLTSPGQSRSKGMLPNERPCMTSYPSLIINLAVSASVSKLWPSEICLTSISPLKVTYVKVNSTKQKGICLPIHHSLAVSASVTKLYPSEICMISI